MSAGVISWYIFKITESRVPDTRHFITSVLIMCLLPLLRSSHYLIISIKAKKMAFFNLNLKE